MEEVILRFPHLIEQIFEKLDNKSLTKSRKVSISWKNVIDNQRYYWIRNVQKQINGYQDSVIVNKSSILRNMKIENLVILAHQTRQVKKRLTFTPKWLLYGDNEKTAFLHIAAEMGFIDLYQFISEDLSDKVWAIENRTDSKMYY